MRAFSSVTTGIDTGKLLAAPPNRGGRQRAGRRAGIGVSGGGVGDGEIACDVSDVGQMPSGRVLHSSTSQLNLCRFCSFKPQQALTYQLNLISFCRCDLRA